MPGGDPGKTLRLIFVFSRESNEAATALRVQFERLAGVEVLGEFSKFDQLPGVLNSENIDAVIFEPELLTNLDGLTVGDPSTRDWLVDRWPSAPVWLFPVDRVTSLSPRELSVFLLLGGGYSNRQIAKEIGISERTTKEHLGRVMAKLGVESRLQAGLISLAHQLMANGPTSAPELSAEL